MEAQNKTKYRMVAKKTHVINYKKVRQTQILWYIKHFKKTLKTGKLQRHINADKGMYYDNMFRRHITNVKKDYYE